MKLQKSKKDNEVFYYHNSKKEKLWCYRHRYYDTWGKRREKSKQGFKTERQAIRALIEVKANILDGNSKQVEYSNLTISDWLDLWYETHKNDWKVSTQIQRENAIKHQMKPLLGKYKLATLDKTTYKRVYINELLKKYKPSTVQLFHRLFKVAINAAVDDEIIPRNRFNKITIEQEEQKDNFLTASELNQLLKTAKKEENITNYSILLVLAYTGLRKGEALGLTWQEVDLERKTITVNRTRDNKGTREPKTKNSYRTILIDDVVINHLEKYKTWCKKTLFEFGKKLNEQTYVFISYQTGEAITDNSVLYGLRRVIKKAGIKKITLHGLRHTHATLLISQRIPVKVIADRLGNTPQMIFDIYGHSFKELEEESVAAFNAILKQVGGTSGEE
ncbi:site-specific integrase [Oceanobacillus piezotolerans]|uniref:Site-specific integrase n=1 Tax=Oceanobacillus piezotolerans TaxID=2448030 RepID=A0A498D9N9_9BACI|nr:tyrosine-type recombinase/integrase [Oceanobacillus piezotolerans]RLL47824.1 site-specific integrase [Oceanobacillus piezotolerans]